VTADPGSATFSVFGTTATLLVAAPGSLRAARAIADAELAAVDRACSRFRPDSELSILNAAEGKVTGVGELFAELVDAALRAAGLTGGAVDPTCGQALAAIGYDRDFAEVTSGTAGAGGVNGSRPVPGWRSVRLDRGRRLIQLAGGAQLDLGATAKAWAADRCAQLIWALAGSGVLVSLGGDIAVAGPAPAGGWQVRVTDDHAAGPGAPGQTITIQGGGLATSSTTVRSWITDGQRVHHIIDPVTGQSASSCWRTVSVAAGSCVDANTASTAAIVRGEGALRWLRDAGLPARLVAHDGTVEITAGWPSDPEAPKGRGADWTQERGAEGERATRETGAPERPGGAGKARPRRRN
jgi:FAD:protein FMN transferase